MVRLQIIERPGVDLYRALVAAMRSGELRTFLLVKRGRKVQHKNPNYHGWMNWQNLHGVIVCEILSPRKPGDEWKLLQALVGRLADKYAAQVHSITIQFPSAEAPKVRRRKVAARKRRRRR